MTIFRSTSRRMRGTWRRTDTMIRTPPCLRFGSWTFSAKNAVFRITDADLAVAELSAVWAQDCRRDFVQPRRRPPHGPLPPGTQRWSGQVRARHGGSQVSDALVVRRAVRCLHLPSPRLSVPSHLGRDARQGAGGGERASVSQTFLSGDQRGVFTGARRRSTAMGGIRVE